MTDLYRITDEILPQKIHELVAEKGLTTANIEHAYKLVDMYKDLKEVEHWESEDMEEGRSQRGRRRDRMGRYSKNQGSYAYNDGENYEDSYAQEGNYAQPGRNSDVQRRYSEAKRSYRSNKSPDCKHQLMETVNEYMEDFAQEMQEMLRDADCKEERDTIARYIQQIRNLT